MLDPLIITICPNKKINYNAIELCERGIFVFVFLYIYSLYLLCISHYIIILFLLGFEHETSGILSYLLTT